MFQLLYGQRFSGLTYADINLSIKTIKKTDSIPAIQMQIKSSHYFLSAIDEPILIIALSLRALFLCLFLIFN